MSFSINTVVSLLQNPYMLYWLISGLMETKSLGMLFGKPAASKSLIAMYIAYCIGNGIKFGDLSVKQGSVIYIAGEGFAGLQRRFKALEIKYGLPISDVHYTNEPINMMNSSKLREQFDIIRAACPNPELIIVDTLHRNFGEGDENSSKDFGTVLSHLTQIINYLGCSILLVHHSGHSDANRSRGSSSITAGLDFSYKVENKNGQVTMVCTKAKEFEKPSPFHFNIEGVDLPAGWLDSNGNIINAPVVVPTNPTMITSSQKPLSQQNQLIFDALLKAIDSSGATHKTNNGNLDVMAISVDVWRQEARQALDNDNGSPRKPDTNNAAIRRATETLTEAGLISIDDDKVWINRTDDKSLFH